MEDGLAFLPPTESGGAVSFSFTMSDLKYYCGIGHRVCVHWLLTSAAGLKPWLNCPGSSHRPASFTQTEFTVWQDPNRGAY